jgi:hypothetical protein
MSFLISARLQDSKTESLRTQYEYLNLLRLRHLQWMTSSKDAETEVTHREIAGLIEQITDRYSTLFRTRD